MSTWKQSISYLCFNREEVFLLNIISYELSTFILYFRRQGPESYVEFCTELIIKSLLQTERNNMSHM